MSMLLVLYFPAESQIYLLPENRCQQYLYAFYRGGNATAVLNGANEEAVYAFLDGKLPFLRIEEIVADAINDVPYVEFPTLADIVESDRLAREYVKDIVELLEVKE